MEAGPSWNFAGVQVTHLCDLCLERKTEAPIQLNDSNSICKDCFVFDLKPKFEAAVQNENAWPVMFGTRLHPSSFPDFFTQSFIAEYTRKEKEYKTPIGTRIYCAAPPCGKFLGGADDGPVRDCSCGSSTTTQTEDDPLEGLRLGRDYQRCPSCRIPVFLTEACNELICPRCGEHFCWICGRQATGEHFRPGGCPRWNHPDESNAHYDVTEQWAISDDPGLPHPDDVDNEAWNRFFAIPEPRRPEPPVHMPALLAQAMDALEAGRPQAPQPIPLREPPPDEDAAMARRRETQNEVRRRAANDIAASMGFVPGPALPRRRR